jgi:homoserine kinase type II
MAVYTEVAFEEAQAFIALLNIGELTDLKACSGGIENTNYFASTTQGEYVLTLFERLTYAQLPYYLHLMKHLAQHGILVPDPSANAQGEILHTLKGKPAAVVNKLRGGHELAPTPAHCAAVGDMLARMHLAARNFSHRQPNLRALPWWNETVPVILPHLSPDQRSLIEHELAYQNHVAASSSYTALPRGPVHADLFRDNVMFEHAADGGAVKSAELTGFFDFYFAGNDAWLFDIAVTLNDWCVDLPTGRTHTERHQALLAAYEAVRPLQAAERQLLPAMLRAGALRFWISRLWDWHLPREASLLKPHDPAHFERVLRQRLASQNKLL